MSTKNMFFFKFFLLIRYVLFEGTFASVFKAKSHKTVEIKFFLTFYA
jgi:hypothetical protein